MKVLLDTHAFLWWITDDPRLSARARRVMGGRSNGVYFSAVSGWEIAIKARLGRLKIGDNIESFITDQVAFNGFQVLPIHLNHALRTHSLPRYHNDPFDRLLIAQAVVEDLQLLSVDRRLADYRVGVIW